MSIRLLFGLSVLLVTAIPVMADDAQVDIAKLRAHATVLASDSLEGRQVGEVGALKAAQYIASVFESIHAQPKGDSGYFQYFDFIKEISQGPDNRLAINGQELVLWDDFQALDYSANGSLDFDQIVDVGYGIITADSSHNDYANIDVSGRAVLIRRYSPESAQADSAESESTQPRDTTLEQFSSLISKITTAIDQGATGIFFITPPHHDDTLLSRGVTKVTPRSVPILFLLRRGLEKLGLSLDEPQLVSVNGMVDLVRVRDTCQNVVGYLPGQTDSVIILGAHYDHLGWGGPASLYRGVEKMIHYGADDNGSGVSALLELARLFASSEDTLRHAVLFIAFSGEEAGLLGSGHYVRNWTVADDRVRLMINMDMIGRLSEQEKGLAVFGTGTCEEFGNYFDSLNSGDLNITPKESGTGPSDHTAFYNDSIPCLFFFTGAHEDYHRPADVEERLDYDGLASVASLVYHAVRHFDTLESNFTFLRTKGDDRSKHRRPYSVTLGIMPDFISEAVGLQIDGVTPDQPADLAGLVKGDIIIRLGEIEIQDIYGYMNALSKFRKGDSTEVEYVRAADTLIAPLIFK